MSAPEALQTPPQAQVVVIPPIAMKQIIDRTIEFVAKSGPAFEETVRTREEDNSRFSFLNFDNIFWLYYQSELSIQKRAVMKERYPGLYRMSAEVINFAGLPYHVNQLIHQLRDIDDLLLEEQELERIWLMTRSQPVPQQYLL